MNIIQDEFPCEKSEIESLERLTQTNLPNDYIEFLLKYNGGIPNPYYPFSDVENKWYMGVERFLSCGDLILQKSKLLKYDDIDLIREYEASKFTIDIDKFLIIGICHRGNLLMYSGEEEKGQIYFSSFLDGDGLSKSPFKNFSELIKSLKGNDWDDIDLENHPNKLNKIFQDNLFQEKDTGNFDLDRFEAVLRFYGNPSRTHEAERKNVYQKYEWNNEILKRIKTVANKS